MSAGIIIQSKLNVIIQNGECIFPANSIKIGDFAFENTPNLKTVHIPPSVEYVGIDCFKGCTELSDVILPNNLSSIGSGAFADCCLLKEITLPSQSQLLSSSIFSNCKNLETVNFKEGLKYIGPSLFEYCSKLKNIKIPESIKEIANGVFLRCISLTDISFPDSIVAVDRYTFWGCSNLKNVKLSKNTEKLLGSCFAKCTAIEEIKIPEKTTLIGAFAFEDCTALKKIQLPNNIHNMGIGVFAGCSKLKSITLPVNMTYVPRRLFDGCSSLEKVILPPNLLSIDGWAFRGCSSLKELFIPNNVNILEENVFDDCSFNYLIKTPNGIKLTQTLDENDNSTENEILDLRVLNKYVPNTLSIIMHNAKAANLKDLYKKYNIAQLQNKQLVIPCNIIADMKDASVFNKFLNNVYNGKFFQQVLKVVDKKLLYSQGYSLYKLAYNLGAFEENLKIRQKACEFLKEKLSKNILYQDMLVSYFSLMDFNGYHPEFANFFMDKNAFPEFMKEVGRNPEFISLVYNCFDEVQRTNTRNRGYQEQKSPTVKKFVDYFAKEKFGHVTPATSEIAHEVGKFFEKQRYFDDAVQIMEEFEKRKLKKDLTKTKVVENTLYNEIDEKRKSIMNNCAKTLYEINKTMENKFTYEFLSKNDPVNLTLGKYCSCCAHLDGVGYSIMRASILHKNCQNMVIRNEKGEIIAKSTLYVNRKEGYGVANNVCVYGEVSKDEKDYIYKKYVEGITAFAQQYNQENPKNPLKQINVGMGLNNLETQITLNSKRSPDILKGVNFTRWGNKNKDHRYAGNWQEEQRIIWLAKGGNDDENVNQ